MTIITYEPITGINVRDDKDINYAQIICEGKKIIETRNTNSLKPYINKRVRIIRTGIKKAQIVGEVTIGQPIIYTSEEEFVADQSRHLVEKESEFFIKNIKYGYPIINPTLYEKFYPAVGTGIISRRNQPYID